MLSRDLVCLYCGKGVEGDSAFCRYCGKPVPRTEGEAQVILDRTADFSHPEDAYKAIGEYLKRWPESNQAIDVYIAYQCIRLLSLSGTLLGGISNAKDSKVPNSTFEFKRFFQNVDSLLEALDAGLPVKLSNGLVTSLRVSNGEKRKKATELLSALQVVTTFLLSVLYKQAEEEAQSLLVDGKTQATIKKITLEQAYQDAKIHYASYEKGDLKAALRGFMYLKELNPMDGYFRNMIGVILYEQGNPDEAFREFLYGLARDPGDVNLTLNTLRCACGFGLYPAAVEILRHHSEISEDVEEPQLRSCVTLANAVTAATVFKAANCTAEDFSPEATDLLKEFAIPERSWLTSYKKSEESTGVLNNARVFISYRHAGGLNYAQHLERALKGAHPEIYVFRDETCLAAGVNFVDQLRDEIDKADVFLALIDRDFAGKGGNSVPRLLDRDDILRREVTRAFEKEKIIVPILLERAQMPNSSDVPEELSEFLQLHAINLSEATFDSDLYILLNHMEQLVKTEKLRSEATKKYLDNAFELWERDHEAGKKLFKPFFDRLQKYVTGKSVHGEGVPSGSVEMEGHWECIATSPFGKVVLQFVTEGSVGTPFSGAIRGTQNIIGIPVNESCEEIKGTWMPVLDGGTVENAPVLGMCLDGLKAGQPFRLIIPFHRWLGRELVGTDEQGVTYSSRNVGPRRKGF